MMKNQLQEKNVNHSKNHNDEMNRKSSNGVSGSPIHSKWNTIYLFLLCVLLGVVVILMLDACGPPSEPWAFTTSPLWDWSSAAIVLSFTMLQGVLYHLPVGQVAEGKMGCNEKRLKYNLNGLHAFVVCAVLFLSLWQCGLVTASSVISRVLSLISAGFVVALLFSLGVYMRAGSANSSQKTHDSNLAHFLKEFALGRDIDPCLGQIDLKQFAMVRIGFIGWAMMDLSYLLTAIETQAALSLSLILVITFQFIYILDFLIDEESVLPTKEFTEEPIGFLMILGEYLWIPFFSSLPVYYLLQRPNHIQFLSSIPIILLFVVGFLLYYLSNEQKSKFRKNPHDTSCAHLEIIQSPSGQHLLVSGFFGWVRHPNYLGDIIMMFAWCLPCGFTSFLPYLPVLQCFNLLRMRATEIEAACQDKHGAAWQEYCQRVPYKLVPFVY